MRAGLPEPDPEPKVPVPASCWRFKLGLRRLRLAWVLRVWQARADAAARGPLAWDLGQLGPEHGRGGRSETAVTLTLWAGGRRPGRWPAGCCRTGKASWPRNPAGDPAVAESSASEAQVHRPGPPDLPELTWSASETSSWRLGARPLPSLRPKATEERFHSERRCLGEVELWQQSSYDPGETRLQSRSSKREQLLVSQPRFDVRGPQDGNVPPGP